MGCDAGDGTKVTDSDNALTLEAHELTRSRWMPRRWLAAHPRVLDGVAVLACVSVQGVVLTLIGAGGDWTAYVEILLASIALLWRRSHPLTVLTVVVALSSAGSILHPGAGYQNIPFVFALYSVASTQPLKRAIVGYAIGVAVPAISAAILGMSTRTAFSPVLLDLFALLALAVGVAVRSQREQREALAELINQRLDNARLTERTRITAEMHDVVAHSLSVMIALANGASSAWHKHPERATEALRDLTDVGRTALVDMRRILQMLQDDAADSADDLLASGHNLPSLEDLIETFRATGLPITFTRSGSPLPPDTAFSMTVYRIVQESLTNVLRYAPHATKVDVALTRHHRRVEIAVVDNGSPRDAARPSHGSGRGLLGIAARAKTYNGTSTTGELDTGGWRVAVVLETPNSRRGRSE